MAGRLGHSHASTTLNIYAAFLPDADQHAANVMAALLSDCGERRVTPR